MKKSTVPLMHAAHILECIEKLEELYRMDPTFDNVYYYDAALRNLQTMSESTQYIDAQVKAQNTHIDWKKISGFRNVLVHDYLGDIDAFIVSNVIKNEMYILRQVIEVAYPKAKRQQSS